MQSIPELLADTPFAEKIKEIIEALPAAAPAAARDDPDDSDGSHPIAFFSNLGSNKPDEVRLGNYKSLKGMSRQRSRTTRLKLLELSISAASSSPSAQRPKSLPVTCG